jgi:DNA-binding LacI/PurR family transcriptional regulator
MVTIYDIAKKTGFSVTTVSKALNNYTDVSQKTRDAILEAVKEMGYLPNSHARTLKTKKSWTIGVIFVESTGLGMQHPFFSAVIESFRKNVEKLGYDLLFASRNISNQKKSYLEHFRYRGVDGVVIVCFNNNDEQVHELMGDVLPSVAIELESEQSSVIFSDNIAGSIKAVEFLYSLGHRQIAHIGGNPISFSSEQRLRGYRMAMDSLGLVIPDQYVVGGEFSREAGYEGMKALLQISQPPTAIFAAGDNIAIGAIEAIREQGYDVPTDFSIVGFDDIELSRFINPPLTTIRQNTDLIGKMASEQIVKQIDQKEKMIESITVPVELVIRQSCKELNEKVESEGVL